MATTLIKLGGSLITDKTVAASYKDEVVKRLGTEIKQTVTSERNYLIGHGSGSFGHVIAKQYGTISGVKSKEEWFGFSQVAKAAKTLNNLVTHSLSQAQLHVCSIQPSASAVAHNGNLQTLSLRMMTTLMDNGIIPLVYGDVAIDEVLGGTIISTETIFTYLVDHLKDIEQIILVGSVDGVLDADQKVISRITPKTLPTVQQSIGGSYGTDVTGGMLSKVTDMLSIVTKHPELTIRIVNGETHNVLRETLNKENEHGTLISVD